MRLATINMQPHTVYRHTQRGQRERRGGKHEKTDEKKSSSVSGLQAFFSQSLSFSLFFPPFNLPALSRRKKGRRREEEKGGGMEWSCFDSFQSLRKRRERGRREREKEEK